MEQVNFLGYSVSADGIKPLPAKVEAVQQLPQPKTVKELRRFLGMVNFYRRFVPNAAILQAPLNELLSGPKVKGSQPINMTPEHASAFEKCKSSLAEATLLAHPRTDAELAIESDASDMAIGAVLQQRNGGNWQPLAFFSRKLSPTQRKYSPYDRELLAIYESIKYFKHMVEARPFTIFTDHKPLTFAFRTRRDQCSPRQFRYLDLIGQYTTDIQYIAGRDNVVADSLSRIEELEAPLDYQSLAEDQASDVELKEYLQNQSGLDLKRLRPHSSAAEVYCDVSMQPPRPFITKPFRRQVFSMLHNLSHPGARASIRLVTQRFIWPGAKRDCRQWARECEQCQRSKVARHTSAPVAAFTLPPARFRHVHLDIVGPLPHSLGYRYCLTAVDRFTRWPEAYPLQEITAEACLAAFLSGWVARFGCPSDITTDQGRQFQSHLFKTVAALLGAVHHVTTAYHPAANGLVERMHRQMKAAIICHSTPQWTEVLPLVLLGLRSAWKEDLQTSAAELVYGEPLRLPGQFFQSTSNEPVDVTDFASRLKQQMVKLAPVPTSQHGSRTFYVPKGLQHCSHVFLREGPMRGSLQPPYVGPYKVLQRNTKTFDIEVKGKKQTVTIDRLKPAYISEKAPGKTTEQSSNPAQTVAKDDNNRNTAEKRTRSDRAVRFPDYYRPS